MATKVKKQKRIEPTEAELVWLIHQTADRGFVLDLDFGPGFVALNESSPNFMDAVRLLAWKRGIGTEGVAGAGI